MEPPQPSGDVPLNVFDSVDAPGEIKKFIQANAKNDPKFQDLQTFLIDWINAELKEEHIVVKSVEEDLYDGLVLHHLLKKIAGMKLEVEEIALWASSQKRKLGVIMEAITQSLQLQETDLKWSLNEIHNKDLLCTLHLIVALAQHFRPDLELPANVGVEVIRVEPTRNGMKTENVIEFITGSRDGDAKSKPDAFDHLFEQSPEKVEDVKKAIVNFVNKHLANLSLTVTDPESQFADGVILLLLIGQLEGYFMNLGSFFLTPSTQEDKVHNVSLALELLLEGGIIQNPMDPADIVNGDLKATLRLLYSLFLRHKRR
eukprot:XP_017945481.1 PREDICTED: gamma-parvin [Xenopus tropicalis]